jgi:hypothetical protein
MDAPSFLFFSFSLSLYHNINDTLFRVFDREREKDQYLLQVKRNCEFSSSLIPQKVKKDAFWGRSILSLSLLFSSPSPFLSLTDNRTSFISSTSSCSEVEMEQCEFRRSTIGMFDFSLIIVDGGEDETHLL